MHRTGSGGAAAPGFDLADILARDEVLLVGYPVPAGLVTRSPRLVWAHHTQAGVSNLARTDLWASQVTLTSSRGAVAATAIAEYALAAAAHFARGLHEAARQKAAGQFTREGYRMLTLRGATMGIIGLGGIGREAARLSRATGMRVIGTRRSVTAPLPDADGADLVLPADRILDVAAESDFLVICSQLTDETQRFINAAVFAAMKPDAVLINVARGEEVDEDALLAACRAPARQVEPRTPQPFPRGIHENSPVHHARAYRGSRRARARRGGRIGADRRRGCGAGTVRRYAQSPCHARERGAGCH